MAKVNQKQVRELLEEYATTRGHLETLQLQRDAALEPAWQRFQKTVEKTDKEYAPQISPLSEKLVDLESRIKAELQKGFDVLGNNFAVKKIESELAIVEVNSREEREIQAEAWLKEVPKSEQTGNFFDTIKVLITKADKFRSDIVNRLATAKRTHTISIRLKLRN